MAIEPVYYGDNAKQGKPAHELEVGTITIAGETALQMPGLHQWLLDQAATQRQRDAASRDNKNARRAMARKARQEARKR
jgi:hypothetical protein